MKEECVYVKYCQMISNKGGNRCTLIYHVQQQCPFHVMLILQRKEFRQELSI